MKPLFSGAHKFISEMTELPLLGATDEEIEFIADALANMIVSGKPAKAKRRCKRVEKESPWMGFILALAAIYGPRVFCLWKLVQAQKNAQGENPKTILEMPSPGAAADVPVN